jgi:pimeloyl-ACP methyl ester carboxylesterase
MLLLPQLLKALAASRPVVIFDTMRTGGSTDTSRTPLTIPHMADSVAGLLQQLRLEKPDVWSWSIGACIGYALLAKHASKLGNVILASGTPGKSKRWEVLTAVAVVANCVGG